MDPIIILQAGVASGTVLLFATIGEIITERSGVMNLGVEGMMLIGAMSAFGITVTTGNGFLGLVVAMLVAGLLALLHGIVTIHFQADQVVSGERLDNLRAAMGEMLSGLEVDVLRLYVEGKSYQEIGDVLGRHVKSIDNALQRIKRKVDAHLTEQAELDAIYA